MKGGRLRAGVDKQANRRREGFHTLRQVAEVFTKHCYMEWRDNVWRDCYADEQYLGTLLASKARTALASVPPAAALSRGAAAAVPCMLVLACAVQP
jgi:hypothetical protein